MVSDDLSPSFSAAQGTTLPWVYYEHPRQGTGKNKKYVAGKTRHIGLQPTLVDARKYAKDIMEGLANEHPEAMDMLDEQRKRILYKDS